MLSLFRSGTSRTVITRNFASSCARLNSTLAFVETSGKTITPSSLSALTAATQLGKPITAVLLGSESTEVALQLAKSSKINKILVSKSEKYNHYLPEEVSPLISKLLKDGAGDFTNFITPASAVGKNLLPRVGAQLDLQPVSDIIKVISADTFVRPAYAGNALMTVKSKDKQVLVSARGSAFPPLEVDEGASKSSNPKDQT
ncbi:unnamed protein product [Ambrosiozyma monospora]|uniref:Unnamed protein product n=1 Tax=Ambrosiozyma monospora TaxID=43982 RepID=A0ACB5UBS4_AMBMO|nr:unnamed protein product [Ambrosiozyma monospora]